MKLGETRTLTSEKHAWGHEIEQIWLTKWNPTGDYRVMGLCVEFAADGTRLGTKGWTTLFSGSLKDARAYAKNLL